MHFNTKAGRNLFGITSNTLLQFVETVLISSNLLPTICEILRREIGRNTAPADHALFNRPR